MQVIGSSQRCDGSVGDSRGHLPVTFCVGFPNSLSRIVFTCCIVWMLDVAFTIFPFL
jgi:hypothetical protein